MALGLENVCYSFLSANSSRAIVVHWVNNTCKHCFPFDPAGHNGCAVSILNTQIGNLLVFNDSIWVVTEDRIHPTAEHAAPNFLGRQSCQWGWVDCILPPCGASLGFRTSSSCLTGLRMQRKPSLPAQGNVFGIKSSGRLWAPTSVLLSALLTACQTGILQLSRSDSW